MGDGSAVVNNPHATGLDRGACGGMTGEASARVGAAPLNDPDARRGLVERGINFPADTWFIGALHDTCVDEVRLYDTDRVPAGYAEELAEVRSWLAQAGEVTRLQRAARLGLASKSLNRSPPMSSIAAATGRRYARSGRWRAVPPSLPPPARAPAGWTSAGAASCTTTTGSRTRALACWS